MSLLMDALSKAEKDRHKVEKKSDQSPEEEVLNEPEALFETRHSAGEKSLALDLSFLSLSNEEENKKEKVEQKSSATSVQAEPEAESPNDVSLLDILEQEAGLPSEPVTTPDPPVSKVENRQSYNIPVLGVAKKTSNLNPWFIGGIVVLLITLGVSYYYFQSLETNNIGSVIGDITPDHHSLQEQANSETVVEKIETEAINLQPELKPVNKVVEQQETVSKVIPKVKAKTSPTPVTPPQAHKEETIHVQREEPKIDYVQQALQKGYLAYQTGDMRSASEQYQTALQYEPNHRDALLGMAVISQQQGNERQAKIYYQKLLTLNPKDSVAMSSLISMRHGSTQSSSESHLKLLLNEEPEAAYLHAALGAQYVVGSRWSEAHQAFLKAYHYDSNNPDYTYNLAVSLDHLGQIQAAKKYYKQALLLSQQYPAGFERSAIDSRLNTLSEWGKESD